MVMFQMEMSVTLVKFVKSYNVLGASIFFLFLVFWCTQLEYDVPYLNWNSQTIKLDFFQVVVILN